MIGTRTRIKVNYSRDVVPNIRAGTNIALDLVAASTLQGALDEVPVGTPESTGIKDYVGGTLKASLQIYKTDMARQVGTDLDVVPYAWYVHDGTYLGYPNGGMPARPYLVNPFEAHKNEFPVACKKIKVV